MNSYVSRLRTYFLNTNMRPEYEHASATRRDGGHRPSSRHATVWGGGGIFQQRAPLELLFCYVGERKTVAKLNTVAESNHRPRSVNGAPRR